MLPHSLQFLSQLSGFVIDASIRAVPVIALILLVQWLFRKILSPAARCNLWLVLAVYLASPWLPSNRFSLHQWLPKPVETTNWSALMQFESLDEATLQTETTEPANSPNLKTAEAKTITWKPSTIAAALWLVGFLAMASRFALCLGASRRILATSTPCAKPEALAVLDACKHQTGVTRSVELRQSDTIFGPAVIGAFKPRIVMPSALLEQLAPDDLKNVLMHEMAHVHRHDMLQAWLMGVLLALHWFNPLMWFANLRLRVDRELACDAFVLSRATGITPRSYGTTMINLLEQCQQSPVAICSAAGILEYKTEIKKRITMIAGYKNTPAWKHVLSLCLCSMLAGVVLNRPAKLIAADSPARSVETKTNAEGHWEDNIDLPFAADEAVIGSWVSVAFVNDPAEFSLSKARNSKRELFLKDLDFYPDGKTNWAWSWTKNYLLHRGDKTASRYEIFQINNEKYLSMEWKSGDYTLHHQKPKYYILKKVSETPRPKPQPIVDNIDLPFVDDPAISGTTWKSVDFVKAPEDFAPDKKKFKGKLFLQELVFNPSGKMHNKFITWTNGFVVHRGDKTASHYEIRVIDGSTYLFFEWKSGDYTIRHMKPQYYVLKKVG